MHSLLKRQLKRYFGDQFRIPRNWQEFINAVNDAYRKSDMDRGMLKRSLELSSQELLQANAEVRAIFQSIPDLLFRLDNDGRILNYKAGATTEQLLHPKELLGKRIQDIPLKQVSEKFREAIQQVQESKTIINIEYSLVVQDQPLFFEAKFVPLPEDQIVVVIRNITERKQTEEKIHKMNEELELRVIERTIQLNSVNKELEAFAYSASHDLWAPLRAIDGYTNMLVEDYGKMLDQEGKRICTIISDETKRMGRLINDLVSFSHVSHADMQISPINMQVMPFSVFYELTTPESRERIDFSVAHLPPAIGDPTLIRQVWMNLISNAVKFSSKQKHAVIDVGYKQDDQEIIYSIRDNGAGFNMQYIDKLFGVFQRLHNEKEFEGTGVGLAIVQRLIHRHGGKVWAESQVDKGATFYFTLPQK
jgi:PAS domain S-box-containing protein